MRTTTFLLNPLKQKCLDGFFASSELFAEAPQKQTKWILFGLFLTLGIPTRANHSWQQKGRKYNVLQFWHMLFWEIKGVFFPWSQNYKKQWQMQNSSRFITCRQGPGRPTRRSCMTSRVILAPVLLDTAKVEDCVPDRQCAGGVGRGCAGP